MKPPNSKIISIAALITALIALLCTAVNARHYTMLISPRTYRFNRSYHDPFDLVSEMIRTPIYCNSMMKQQQNEVTQLGRSTPRYTVSEENGVVQLEIEVPGVSAKDIEIDLEDQHLLRIKGKRKHRLGSGSIEETEFDVAFRLNDGVDPSQLKAILSAGILQVQVPNKEKETRRISIVTDVEGEAVTLNELYRKDDGETTASSENILVEAGDIGTSGNNE